MIRNYLIVAFRNLLRNKALTAINVAGLGLGLASVFVIATYLQFELSYDRFHESADNIYRVTWYDDNPQPRTPHPMAQAMVADFPEVESAVSLSPLWGFGLTRQTFSVRNLERDIRYDERNVLAVDSTFFDVFTFPLVKGDPNTALKQVGGCLLSESTARKYFGDEDPIGKKLAVNDEESLVEVVGVFKDVPRASHMHFDFLVSYVREKALDGDNPYYSWADFGHYNYVRLRPGADPNALEAKLLPWVAKYVNVSDEVFRAAMSRGVHFELQPITNIHLKSHLIWELEPNGYIAYVYMLAAAGILILVIAIINFINLTSAQSADRSREIGIRKALGAYKSQLATQFTGEALVVSLMAVVLAAALIELGMPIYRQLTGVDPSFGYATVVAGLLGLGLLTGVLAGVFPSFRLAALRPTLILKGSLPQASGGKGLRKVFITFQFFASMTLICSSVIIYNQLAFVRQRPLGFDQEAVINIPVKNPDAIVSRMDALRQEMLKVPGVLRVSGASNIPGSAFNRNTAWNANDPTLSTVVAEEFCDYDFFSTLGIALADGRLFLRENPADEQAFVINESAARAMFPEGAVGKEMVWDDEPGQVRGTVIGVVKDFNFQSLHEPVKPLIFRQRPRYNHVVMKIETDNLDERMAAIEKTWRTFDDEFGFEFRFLRDELNTQYAEERNLSMALTAFAGLATAIACFGLLGIAALSFRQKVKEVSIRKVMGASVERIIMLLLGDFTRMVLAAVAVAVPVTWWAMNNWLSNFTYHTTVNPLVFVAVGAGLLVVAWGTLGYLTLQVAKTNPAETLKGE
ncbi:MAG: ABC transporter permease [Cyclobacteriaceae bacterium]|nr:ABC transporter permease [Cyclobacteriaceae bacterium]